VAALREDRRGHLWIGTYGGLCRFVNGKFIQEFTNDGEQFNRALAIYEDREGSMWIGTKDGLFRLTPRHFNMITKQQGLSHNNVMSVFEDKDNNLWIGTWGGGLNRIQNNQITSYPGIALVLGLGTDAQNRLCVGT